MISRRKMLSAVCASLAAVPLRTVAQKQGKVWRIGHLSNLSGPSSFDLIHSALVQGMRELGYVEGRDLVVEARFADNRMERLPALAAELVQLKVDVIVTESTPGALAAKGATRSIPIVAVDIGDPVGNGLAVSLARPGGNVTGQSLMALEIRTKQLELLKTVVPGLSRVAFLMNFDNPGQKRIYQGFAESARKSGVRTFPVNARTSEEIEAGISVAVRKDRAQGLMTAFDSTFFAIHRQRIVDLANKRRLPAIYPYREFVEAGGLMSYGQDIVETYRDAAIYVDKILKGANPGELPFQQPTRFYLAINRRTAKALGLTIPQDVLLRADRVIE
jgi:putative ABC transport system substrate-binding protein